MRTPQKLSIRNGVNQRESFPTVFTARRQGGDTVLRTNVMAFNATLYQVKKVYTPHDIRIYVSFYSQKCCEFPTKVAADAPTSLGDNAYCTADIRRN